MAYIDDLNTKIPDFLRDREEYKLLMQMIKENNIDNNKALVKFIDDEIEEAQQSLNEEKQPTATIGSVNTHRREIARKLDVLNYIKKEFLRYL